jgi:histidinol-phosphate aminotransferase
MARTIAELPGFSVTPSAANFLWVKTSMPAEQVFSALVADKILVRSFHASGGRMASQLRITVGTDTENARLLESLGKTARRA